MTTRRSIDAEYDARKGRVEPCCPFDSRCEECGACCYPRRVALTTWERDDGLTTVRCPECPPRSMRWVKREDE